MCLKPAAFAFCAIIARRVPVQPPHGIRGIAATQTGARTLFFENEGHTQGRVTIACITTTSNLKRADGLQERQCPWLTG